MKKPCKECPYLKNSLPGYLGDASYYPELFLNQLETPVLHPCHTAINWEEATAEEIENAPICTGALQFMNNTCKSSRYGGTRTKQHQAGKNANVFDRRSEFIKHHS
jgi:hypothetical protein